MVVIEPNLEKHILERLHQRAASDVGLPWLYRLIQMINDYLPNDWRLGARSNGFVIRTFGQRPVTMTGVSARSYRNPEHIYHIVKTILPMGTFSKEERFQSGEDVGREVSQRPNLYVLEIPDDENIRRIIKKNWFYDISPIAARQYEKINLEQNREDPYEYHRVHPLTKQGIQLDVFGWVRWHKSGAAKWGPDIEPEAEWHGESFWKISEVVSQGREDELHRHYNERLFLSRKSFQ